MFSLLALLLQPATASAQDKPPPASNKSSKQETPAPPQIRLVLSDLSTQEGQLVRANQNQLTLLQQGTQRDLPLATLFSLETVAPQAPRETSRFPWIVLGNNDRISAETQGIADDTLFALWPTSPQHALSIPLETVRGIVLADAPSVPQSELWSRLFAPQPEDDELILTSPDRPRGELSRFDGRAFHIESPAGNARVTAEKVVAVRFNPSLLSLPTPPLTRQILVLNDGSWLTLASFSTLGLDLQAKTTSGVTVIVPWTSIHKMIFFTPQIRPLSDLEPVSYSYTPFLSGDSTWHRNLSSAQSWLAIRRQQFPSGIGVRSRSRLTYNLNREFAKFHSWVGIDDAAHGKGSCRFRLESDGRVLWESPELTGESPPHFTGLIDVSGVQELSLVVDYGRQADILDLADWCLPVLLKK